MNLSLQEQAAFWAQEPVGDLAGRYYTAADGTPVDGVVNVTVVSVTLADLDRIPQVVGVAPGGPRRTRCSAACGTPPRRPRVDESLARSLLSPASGP